MKNLIEMNHLRVSFDEPVVNDISFTVRPGEIVGIVGESGSGKSMTALSVMGLLPLGAKVSYERYLYEGKPQKPILGKDIAMIFQEPMTSLNPVQTIGWQVEEMLQIHKECEKSKQQERVQEMFGLVGLPVEEAFLKRYPHELSGGQRQRVMIAMALICNPRVLIADEPTTALDALTQTEILSLLEKLNKELSIAILFISHDILLVHKFCGHVFVMENGEIVERGDTHQVFHHPQEAYTKSLLAALPSAEKKQENTQIGNEVMLSVNNLVIKRGEQEILKDVTFSLNKGEILGIMGPSGCGKSTLSQALTGLLPIKNGTIDMDGHSIRMVFQDPYGSLNPSKTVGWILEEPLKIQGELTKVERKARVCEFLREVGLREKHAGRRVSGLSGGQRQRVAIAAALITYPDILILDEPVSALDVTIQDKICKLLVHCKEHFALSYLFISHDPEVMAMMCDRILYLQDGRLVEEKEGKINESN